MSQPNQRRALVTGAGKRVGRAMALYLGQRGFDVAVHYSASQADANDVAASIRDMGQTATTLKADLLQEDQVQALMSQATDALGGPVHVLINNASIFEQDTYESASRESWDMHIESNLRAPFVLTQALAAHIPDPLMDDMNEPLAQGLVINMIDQRVRKLTPDFASYTIAKMGLWAMTRTAAQALAPRVRVNGIGPGPTLQSTEQTPVQFARQRARTILKRGANTSDITAALGYFIDAPAITGQLLCVDGGQHLAWQTPDVMGVDL
jgi:NAD(P)-dependent dehydrogenase (short-subunit alcohol dehydrogenase family)